MSLSIEFKLKKLRSLIKTILRLVHSSLHLWLFKLMPKKLNTSKKSEL